ncbi:winged helix-turn-helix domain-containing protein [Aurantimonas sp. VKM B-3413]|uniref:winged helix-turn-helix domain-containing protein n=1 Tax=Aurantimonas sp. VKM B-3413 TaxID=2779401 RepID=UPI001E56503D|nr:LysR family transcriptional regulator [Aurantimonas sp. VKM B-3413]MCB8836631.1 LysR family transcriptional regulator [Aurantimonas sp. VKM B-3413]
MAETTVPSPPALGHLRVSLDGRTSIGPGKANLLEAIGETGSIAAAGRRLKMSYKRAWSLVDDLNAAFREPLVASSRGGSAGGGAVLTPAGERVLAAYRAMQAAAERAIAQEAADLRGLLADPTQSDVSK